MYFVGIDFGHGETTASCYNTEKGKVERLHILDGNDDESNKVEFAVCRNKKTGEWQFAKDIQDYASPDFTLHFKAPMNEISEEKKEAFGKFIKLVFDHIMENHKSILNYNPETGEKNFELYAACPSGWGKDGSDQIKAYKEFMSGIIPIDWIFKESDAAYFKFKEETKKFGSSAVLVIDVGSSTIDFTAYGEDGFSSLSDGKKHGASAVERSLFKHFDANDKDFQNAKQEALPICQKDHKNWDDAVVHYIKNRKEYYYTKELNVMRLDLSNKMICLPNISKSRVFDDITVTKEQLEDDILSSYRQTLLDDIKGVKEQIGKVDIVILTGGASRMPWLQQLVRDIFPEPVVCWRFRAVVCGFRWYSILRSCCLRIEAESNESY